MGFFKFVYRATLDFNVIYKKFHSIVVYQFTRYWLFPPYSGVLNRPSLLSICTGIFGTFDILQFKIYSLMNWDFFLVWKQTGYFYQFKLIFFPSFWARAKYFDGPCLTIFPFYNLKRYTLPAFGLVDSLYPLLWIKRNENLGNSISVHFGITLLTIYPIWDFGFC